MVSIVFFPASPVSSCVSPATYKTQFAVLSCSCWAADTHTEAPPASYHKTSAPLAKLAICLKKYRSSSAQLLLRTKSTVPTQNTGRSHLTNRGWVICSEPELSTTQPQCLCRRESGFSTHPASRGPESSCLKAAQSCSGPVWMTAGEIFSIHSPVWQFGQLQTLPKLSEPVSVLGNFPACKFPMQQNQQSSGHFFCVSYRNSRLRKELCTVRQTDTQMA